MRHGEVTTSWLDAGQQSTLAKQPETASKPVLLHREVSASGHMSLQQRYRA